MQPAQRSARVAQIVAAGRRLLETEGPQALTMRRVAAELGIQAPSLYKHLPDKASLEALLVEDGLREMGAALHASVSRGAPSVRRLLQAYRRHALAHPELYRLLTQGPLDRAALPAGLEEWAGQPFWLAAGRQPFVAQALWAAAHGMAVLEIDGRFPDPGTLDSSWRALATAFVST
jgi:AcrR family transcriptional regulator